MTETKEFNGINVDLNLIFEEIKAILDKSDLQIAEESSGTDKEGNSFLSLHAKLPESKAMLEKITRAFVGAQRDLLIVVRGTPERFFVEIAAGKMAENLLVSGLTGLVIAGPLFFVLPSASVVFSRKFEIDLRKKIEQAIETISRVKNIKKKKFKV